MSCGITDPLSCAGQLAGSAASSAWDAICLSFATAADELLRAFGRAFTAIPPVDLASPGVKNVYAICLGAAAFIAVLLVLGQVIRTALTHDGSGLAEALTGIGKAAAAVALTLVVASAAVTAADNLTGYIIDRSFGSAARLTAKITTLLSFARVTGHPGAELAGGASLLLLLAVAGIVLILVLWFELLLRSAAIAVLVATSPIAAAGMTSAPTREWWPKMAVATGHLIVVKPVIALVFALGLELTGTSHDIETLLAGMLILLLAAVAWPVIARFFTFTAVGTAGSAGLGLVLGFAAGRLTGGSTPSGGPGGKAAQPAEASGADGAGAGEGAAGAAAAGATAAGAAAGVLALAAAGVQAAHRASTALAGQMGQAGGHAGYGQGWYSPGQRGPARAAPGQASPRPPQSGSGQDTAFLQHGWAGGQSAGSGEDWPEPDPDPWRDPAWPQDRPAADPDPPAPASPDQAPSPPDDPAPPAMKGETP